MPNYTTSRVYKIWSPSHPGEIYIGSTTQDLAKRIGEHRRKYKLYLNGKYRYTTSFKIMEYGDAKIELIEKVECKDKEELIACEGYYIRTLDCVNKVIPDRTKKEYDREYRQANRERIAQREKEYREANREKIAQKKAEKVKCNCGSVINRGGLSEHRRTKKHMKYLESIKS